MFIPLSIVVSGDKEKSKCVFVLLVGEKKCLEIPEGNLRVEELYCMSETESGKNTM